MPTSFGNARARRLGGQEDVLDVVRIQLPVLPAVGQAAQAPVSWRAQCCYFMELFLRSTSRS
jgi:hypothetical protein